jgi:hypothetical protein
MLTMRTTRALAAIVALGLGCAACTTGGNSSYGSAAPADPHAASAPGTGRNAPAAAPMRAYQSQGSDSGNLNGGGGGMGSGMGN